MSAVEGIRSEQDGAILKITINRPEYDNLMTDETAAELARLLDDASRRSAFVVLRAAGKTFCSGWGDLRKLPQAGTIEAFERLKKYDIVFNCYSAFRRCHVPIVGIVQGPSRGFGCAIAALCDITLASNAAVFQVPELEHCVLPTMVMSALVDRIPLKAINYLVSTAVEISADRALAYGIVSEVVPASTLDAAAAALCERLTKAPRVALSGLKQYTRSAAGMHVQGAVDFARNLHATINTSSEMRRPG